MNQKLLIVLQGMYEAETDDDGLCTQHNIEVCTNGNERMLCGCINCPLFNPGSMKGHIMEALCVPVT